MGLYDSNSAVTSDLSNNVTETSVSGADTEISLYTPDWTKWLGYYKQISRLQAVIDKVAIWTAGNGIKAKESSKQAQLDKLRGYGKDTSRDIVINLLRTSSICGDAFAEIIKNKRGELINLKPLSPGTIQIEANNKGIITAYNQISFKMSDPSQKNPIRLARWSSEEIFHLPWNRIADSISGISTIEKLERTIIIKKTAEEVMNKIVRRNAKPIIIIETDFDDTAKMANIKTKYHNLIENDEAMVVPKDAIKFIDFASKLNIDFMPWLSYLEKDFLISEGVPEVILGAIAGKEAEGASKILYLAWEQVVKNRQNWFEEQWKSQIGFEIDLPEPPSIDPLVLTDSRKAGSMNAGKGNDRLSDIDPTGQNK